MGPRSSLAAQSVSVDGSRHPSQNETRGHLTHHEFQQTRKLTDHLILNVRMTMEDQFTQDQPETDWGHDRVAQSVSVDGSRNQSRHVVNIASSEQAPYSRQEYAFYNAQTQDPVFPMHGVHAQPQLKPSWTYHTHPQLRPQAYARPQEPCLSGTSARTVHSAYLNAQALPKSLEYKSFRSYLTCTVNHSLEDRGKADQDRENTDQTDQARILPKSSALSRRLNRVEENMPNVARHGDLLTLADAASHLDKVAQCAPGIVASRYLATGFGKSPR